MIQTPYHGLTSVALGRCPWREFRTFIPAFMHGAFCDKEQTGLCCGLMCISEDFWN